MQSAASIDRAQLDRATFGDRALRREVLTLFDRQAAALATEIAGTSDAAARANAAHRLRGAALGVGASGLADAAAAFEPGAADATRLADALSRLAAQVEKARAAAAALLAEG